MPLTQIQHPTQVQVQVVFDPATWTVSYAVFDHPGGHCAMVDPMLDRDPKTGRDRISLASGADDLPP